MIKYFRKAFSITNDNIVLTIPLVLCLLIFSIYLGFAKTTPENIQAIVLLLVTVILMISAFWAGWLYMVKSAINLDKKDFYIEEEKSKASFDLLKEFPVGIGEYFIPALGGFIFYLVLLAIFGITIYFIGMHFIGKIGLSLAQLKVSLATTEATKHLVTSLSKQDLIKLNAWNFLFLGAATLFSFITMFWSPQVIYNTKNPFKAFFISLKNIIIKPFGAIVLFIYISCLNFIISLINALAGGNSILYFFA